MTRRVVSSRLIGPTVSSEVARLGLAARRAERPEPGRELLVGERLHEVVVGARVEAGDPVADRVAGGEHEDRELAPLPAQAPGDLEPGDVRQADVEDHGLDPGAVLGDRQAGLAVERDVDDVAVLLEEPPQGPAQALVVLDDEEMHRAPPTGRR